MGSWIWGAVIFLMTLTGTSGCMDKVASGLPKGRGKMHSRWGEAFLQEEQCEPGLGSGAWGAGVWRRHRECVVLGKQEGQVSEISSHLSGMWCTRAHVAVWGEGGGGAWGGGC